MRKIAFWILLPGLMAFMLILTTGLALAELAPFHPGDVLYSLQYQAEQALVTLTPDSNARAETLLDILQRRTADLGNSGDPVQALQQFDLAFSQAMQTLANASDAYSADLRTQSMAVLARAHDKLTRLAETGGTQADSYTARISPIEAFMKSLADLGRPFNALLTGMNGQPVYGLSPQFSTDSAPGPAGDPKAQAVVPHRVAFQAGSKGAQHDFFPLTGRHATIECADCHTDGLYAGKPTTCTACHSAVEPANHFPGECSLCHSTDAWKPARFDHTLAMAANCTTCHQPDKPANHWDGECSLCHAANAWKPATFNHAAAGAADCQSCHSQNRPANHWQGQCSLCHNTTNWKQATFNHAAMKASDCQSCHSQNRPANHWQGQCSLCHNFSAWNQAMFNHAAMKASDCQSCHNQNRPANHWQGQCSLCHNTTNWRQATFNHAAIGAVDCQSCHVRPANHWQGQCSGCHNTNAWKPANFNHALAGAVDCQACHSRPANHFQGQCSTCHTTSAWKPATFSHSFPMNHGNANGSCASCHTNGGSGPADCFMCHNRTELDKKHAEKGIADYASRCLQCHPGGKKQ